VYMYLTDYKRTNPICRVH